MIKINRQTREMEPETIEKNGARWKSLMSRRSIMQRTLLLFAAFWVSIASISAQDIITLKNGDDIQALVQEIGEVDVKYKKFDNPNGPNYTLKKSEIFTIRYANGSKDIFSVVTTVPEPEKKETATPVPVVTTTPAPAAVKQSAQNNKGEVYLNFWGTLKYVSDKSKVKNVETLFYDLPEASKIYNSGKTWSAIGGSIMGVGFSIGFYDIINHKTYNHNYYNCPIYWTGLGIVLVGGIFNQVGSSKQSTAIGIYNASVRRQQTSNVSLDFGITQSGGIGFALNF